MLDLLELILDLPDLIAGLVKGIWRLLKTLTRLVLGVYYYRWLGLGGLRGHGIVRVGVRSLALRWAVWGALVLAPWVGLVAWASA